MTIYVDELPGGWGRWSGGAHMMGTDIHELHAFAIRLGLRREWFQDKRLPHYDLTASKRAKALAAGAQKMELGEIPAGTLIRNEDGTYRQRGNAVGVAATNERTERR